MLEGKILKLDNRHYVMAEWDGENRSGYRPLDDKVLVLLDAHSDTTAGGVYVPDQIAERQTMAAETGVIVALGPAAFRWNDDGTRAWEGDRPAPGDRIYISRYAGQVLLGRDGKQYRLMDQKCVGAVALPEEAAPEDNPGLPVTSVASCSMPAGCSYPDCDCIRMPMSVG